MQIGVFIQAYNTAQYVEECVASVLGQRGTYSLDVLVIDDASTDDTVARVAAFNDPRVRLIRHTVNHGAIATANEGYTTVNGWALVRLDSDDRLRPDFLELTVPRLLADESAGLVYGDIATIDQNGVVTSDGGLVERNGRPEIGDEFFPLLLQNFVPAPGTLVRRSALLPLLPIPSEYRFLDWYLTTGIAETWRTIFVDRVVADYRIHGSNMHRAMILDRSGERTSLAVLDRLFGNAARTEEKRQHRQSVYASHYLTYAEKYFGVGMNDDARRCYWAAIERRPSLAFNAGIARRFAATVIGRGLYERAKRAATRPKAGVDPVTAHIPNLPLE